MEWINVRFLPGTATCDIFSMSTVKVALILYEHSAETLCKSDKWDQRTFVSRIETM